MTDENSQGYRAITLGAPTRWASGLLGLVSGAVGAFSVFANTNQAGSTALLLLGGIFVLIGLTGRVPERIGKDGLDYKPTERELAVANAATAAVDQLMDSESEDVRSTVAESFSQNLDLKVVYGIDESALSAERRSSMPTDVQWSRTIETLSKARGILFEQSVERVLLDSFSADAVELEPKFISEDGKRAYIDAIVSLPNETRVAVVSTVGAIRLADLELFQRTASEYGIAGMVVVRGARESGVARAEIRSATIERTFSNVRVIDVATEFGEFAAQGADKLLSAIRSFA